jgi:hypothetical protein
MIKELVIAAYDRDYSWVNKLNPKIKITPYRKGDNPLLPGEAYIPLNQGRDVHTFFYHLFINYNNLADVTFFSQDYPFDHVQNYIDIINGDEKLWTQLSVQSIPGCWFFCTQYNVLTCDKQGAPHHPGLNLEKMWNQLFDIPCPNSFHFTPTGHFAISKEYARKLPRSRYKQIINILETQPTSPWEIERLEPYILSAV